MRVSDQMPPACSPSGSKPENYFQVGHTCVSVDHTKLLTKRLRTGLPSQNSNPAHPLNTREMRVGPLRSGSQTAETARGKDNYLPRKPSTAPVAKPGNLLPLLKNSPKWWLPVMWCPAFEFPSSSPVSPFVERTQKRDCQPSALLAETVCDFGPN